MKRFIIGEGNVGTYTLVAATADKPAITAQVDLNKVFGFGSLPELAQKAVAFAVAHVLRNATAGKMENVDEALKAVADRVKALADGKWTAHKESGDAGESSISLLATALSRVMGTTPQEAAEFISNEIRNALEEKDHDPDADSDDLTAEQKTARRKIANAVRKSISEDPAVSVELGKVKLERDQAALAEKQKNAEGKTSAFTKK